MNEKPFNNVLQLEFIYPMLFMIYKMLFASIYPFYGTYSIKALFVLGTRLVKMNRNISLVIQQLATCKSWVF